MILRALFNYMLTLREQGKLVKLQVNSKRNIDDFQFKNSNGVYIILQGPEYLKSSYTVMADSVNVWLLDSTIIVTVLQPRVYL